MKAITKFGQLKKILNSHTVGSLSFEEFILFEQIKKKDYILYHVKNYDDEKIIIMIVKKHGKINKD